MDCVQKLILRMMEDPEERDRKHREHFHPRMEVAKWRLEKKFLPLRPYGFWTFDRHNAQLFWDPQISHVCGRRDPYDEVLEEIYKSSN